jgi:hypothetical protein
VPYAISVSERTKKKFYSKKLKIFIHSVSARLQPGVRQRTVRPPSSFLGGHLNIALFA